MLQHRYTLARDGSETLTARVVDSCSISHEGLAALADCALLDTVIANISLYRSLDSYPKMIPGGQPVRGVTELSEFELRGGSYYQPASWGHPEPLRGVFQNS